MPDIANKNTCTVAYLIMEYFPSSSSLSTPLMSSATLLLLPIILFYLIKPHKKVKNRLPLPPGPKPWPLVGCLPSIIRNRPVYRWIHNLMKEMNTEIACIRLGDVHLISVTCPKIACEFLKVQGDVFASRPDTVASSLTSKGYLATVVSPHGDQWKKMKSILATQVLSPARHRWLQSKRVEEADNLVRYVSKQCKESGQCALVNLRFVTQHYCANVIRRMMFNKRHFGRGMEDGGPGFEEEEHVEALFSALNHLFSFYCISDFLPRLRGLDLVGHEKLVKEKNKIIDKYHDPIIDGRILQLKNGTKNEMEDLLDVLITLKDDSGNSLLSKDEIRAQVADITLAAVDNPSNACEWAFAEMLNHPNILEKAVEELDRVVGKDRLVQESDFAQLNYVKACVREAFRLHPIAPFNVPHVSLEDTVVANYFIPKGSHVILSRLGLGRNPKVWEEPLKFKPERHLAEMDSVVLSENKLRFISFSTGKRGCMAVTLGSSMTIMLFARLLQGFSWSLPPNESRIDLSTAKDSLALAKPLLALPKPRLPAQLYPN